MLLNSVSPEHIQQSKDEGMECLHRIKQTLEIRHLCPTAPDTLRVYPFKDSDPFVISPIDDNLNLGDDEETTTQNSKSLFTQPPHVYFVGNMQAYKEELLTDQAPGKMHQEHLKLISLPTFAKSHSLVLMDMATWQSYEVVFDLQLDEMMNSSLNPNTNANNYEQMTD